MTSSDAETVLVEDSPLSPCIWMHSAQTKFQQQPVQEKPVSSSELCSLKFPASRHGDSSVQDLRRELLLSPASQLNVLSHISELADAESRQSPTLLEPIQQAQRAHVWAPAVTSAKRKNAASHVKRTASKTAKRQRTNTRKSLRSQAERLNNDMVDWETCSEGDLLMLDIDEETNLWVYDDISDSDFDA